MYSIGYIRIRLFVTILTVTPSLLVFEKAGHLDPEPSGIRISLFTIHLSLQIFFHISFPETSAVRCSWSCLVLVPQ